MAGDAEIQQPDYPFPMYVGFILGNEFCERYANTGLRAILTIFLFGFVGFDKDLSTVIYHLFEVMAYMMSLFGAALADGYWGKYKTILRLSIVYAIGMIVIAVSAIPFDDGSSTYRAVNAGLVATGLIVTSIGTGGIKPCVSSFGGDQFETDDVKGTSTFFDLFYWAINAGSLISLFVSPILRTTTCGSLGTEESCFFLAFVIPAGLFIVAIALFIFGDRYYKKKPPSGTNIFVDTLLTMWYGLWNKIPKDSPVQDHWLYGAYGKVDTWIIRDTTYLVKVLVMFLPITIFWAAFDQQGSRWTLQAINMNGYIGSLHILPDQAQILNPVLILTFIPIFNWLYKAIDNCLGFVLFTQLRKINIGMVFAAIAYFIAAAIQSKIDVNLTVRPAIESQIALKVVNMASSPISGNFDQLNDGNLPEELDPKTFIQFDVPVGGLTETIDGVHTSEIICPTVEDEENEDGVLVQEYSFKYAIDEFDTDTETHNIVNYANNFEVTEGRQVWTIAVADNGKAVTYAGWGEKDTDGKAHAIVTSSLTKSVNVTFICEEGSTCSKQKETVAMIDPCFEDESGSSDEMLNRRNSTHPCVQGSVMEPDGERLTLLRGNYSIVLTDMEKNQVGNIFENIEIGTGAGYTFVLTGDNENPNLSIQQDINTNDISLLLIIPQFFVITVAEVLISITGLEFAYTQAPVSLKSVLTAWWLLTVSVGNIVVIIVAEGQIMSSQVGEYLLFAGMIICSNLVFLLLSIFFYEYVAVDEFDNFDYPNAVTGSSDQKSEGIENDAVETTDAL